MSQWKYFHKIRYGLLANFLNFTDVTRIISMSSKRPIFICAFANDEQYRLQLEKEEGEIRRALQGLDGRGDIEYKNIGQTKLEDLFDSLAIYDNRIYIFHYGGHSDQKGLDLKDRSLKAESLAGVLGRQKKLKLAFLNGCGNHEQVHILQKNGVKAVIATHAKIGDERATQFSERFYSALASGLSIGKAFDDAALFVKNDAEIDIVKELYRGLDLDDTGEGSIFPWGLYVHDETVLDWHIGMVEKERELEALDQLRQASSKRYQLFTSSGGRFQHLKIDEAILAGIQGVQTSGRALIDANVELNGQTQSLLQSIKEVWNAVCPHVMLVGSGGMGKTVSLLDLWKHFLGVGEGHTCVPLFIQLNEFNNYSGKDFIRNYILAHYAAVDIDLLGKASSSNTTEPTQPKVLLLLDGLNEVTASSSELLMEINRLKVREDYPGVQLVLTSRTDLRDSYQWQSFHLLALKNLSDAQIKAYLQKDLPRDPKLLELIRNPMMLSIYATQSELPKTYLEKGLLKKEVTSTGELLFNVEAIQRIKIEENHAILLSEQFKQRFVLEHLLPYLGWVMQQAGAFSLKEEEQGQSPGLLPLLAGLNEKLLSRDFFQVFKEFRKLGREALQQKEDWELLEVLIDQICCQALCLLVLENGSYRFLHQNFRDYFAARYVQNEIHIALQRKVFPETFKQRPLDFYVRQMLGELEGEHTNKLKWIEAEKMWRWSKGEFFLMNNLSKLLEQCRGVFDENQLGYTIWNLFTLWKEMRGEYSGADLRKLNFQEFSMNGLRTSREHLPCNFSGTVLKEENIFSQGHLSVIKCVSYSPDGNQIISGSEDETIKVWDAQTGQCLLTLKGHSSFVNCVAYSPDGEQIISGSLDKTVRVWDTRTGKCLLTLNEHLDGVNSMAFNPDGTRIVIGSHSVTIWDVRTGLCLLTLVSMDIHSMGHHSVAFSPDGARIVSGSWDKTVKVWNAYAGHCLLTLTGHSNFVDSVAFSPDGERIISGSWDKTVKVWNAHTGQCLLTLMGCSENINSVAFSPDGSRIISGSRAETKIWDAQTGKCLLTNNSSGINCVAFSPDGSRIISGGVDNKVKIWDSKTGNSLLTLGEYTGELIDVFFNPDGSRIAFNSGAGNVKFWDVYKGRCILILEGRSYFPSIADSPDRSRIVKTRYSDKTAKVTDSKTGKILLTLEGHSTYVWRAAYDPDGQHIVTSSFDETAKVWDAHTGQCLLTLTGHANGVTSAVYNPDGSQIVTGSFDKTAKVWDAYTGQCLLTLTGHSKGIMSVAYNPDGSCIVSGSSDKEAKVWDAHTGHCLLTLTGHTKGITTVTYNPDGSYILSGSEDKTAKVWNAQTGENLQTLPNIPGLFIQGCDFRNLHPNSNLSEESIALLRQYGGIFDDEDARQWEELMERHFPYHDK